MAGVASGVREPHSCEGVAQKLARICHQLPTKLGAYLRDLAQWEDADSSGAAHEAALPPDLLPMPVRAVEDELKGLDTELRDWILVLVGVVNYVASSGKVKPVWQKPTSAQKSFLVRLQDDMKIFMDRSKD